MRFFTTVPLIFLLSEQTDALWPFTASARVSTVAEAQPQASNVQVTPSFDPAHFPDAYEYRNTPEGLYAFPKFGSYIGSFPGAPGLVPLQDDGQQQEEQPTEQAPDNSGTKGGSTEGGTKTPGTTPPTKRRYWPFWGHRKPVVKQDFVNPEVVQPVGSEASVVNVQNGDTVYVPDGHIAVDSAQFTNGFFQESVPKHTGRFVMPWNWVWNGNQAQVNPQETGTGFPAPVAPVPVAGVTHPLEASEQEGHSVTPPKRKFTLPQFGYFLPNNFLPNLQKLPNFIPNFFTGKPAAKPQVGSPGQHCQCWNTGPAVFNPTVVNPAHVQGVGFPAPYTGVGVPPGHVATDPYPVDYSNDHKVNPHVGPAPVTGSHDGSNVNVVVSSNDHTGFETNVVPTKVAFPATGSDYEPIPSETSNVPATVVAPAPVPPTPVVAPPTNPQEPAPVSATFSEETGSGTGTPPVKAMTFSGSVPGGSTTPQGKQFSIGKTKFNSASTAAKTVKKPTNP